MDADLVRLVRSGKITQSLAEQRASVPEELRRLLVGAENPATVAASSTGYANGNGYADGGGTYAGAPQGMG
jgi:hypothetical protein